MPSNINYVRRMSNNMDIANITAADTTPREPVGTVVVLPSSAGSGPLILRYIYNGEGSSAIAAKDVVTAKTSATTLTGTSYGAYDLGIGVLGGSANLAMTTLGIARYSIPAGSYGYVTAVGRVTATAAGAISAGVAIVTAASADVDTVGSNDGRFVIGFCTVAAGGAGDVSVFVNLPNVSG